MLFTEMARTGQSKDLLSDCASAILDRLPTADELLAQLRRLPDDERAALLVEVVQRGPGYRYIEDALTKSFRAFPEEQLCALMLHITRQRAVCASPWGFAWSHAQKHIKKSGISPPLHDALRAMQTVMYMHASDKNANIAIDRALWFETHLPIDLTACASGVVRRDLRGMHPDALRSWKALLEHGMAQNRGEPKELWVTKATPLLEQVGQDTFVASWREWQRALIKLAGGRPLVLTPAGADAIRALVWYGTLARTDDIDHGVAALAALPWARKKPWSPRHDRMVGGLAYAVGKLRPTVARPILDAFSPKFGKTTAKYAIESALAKLGPQRVVVAID